MPPPRQKNLWQNQDFVKLWTAQTVSAFGTQIASLAYPLTAILLLQATAFQMGILRATGAVSGALLGFFAGVVVDRASRRWLLIFTDLGRAVLAAFIAITALTGTLRIEFLYLTMFFAGALNITSEIAGMAYLPSLIEKEKLVEGNSKFAAAESTAAIAGPSLSGMLVQILSAPAAIFVDAVSFVFSALLILLIPAPEPAQDAEKPERKGVWADIVEGLNFVYKNPILRPLAEGIALHFLFMLMISTLFLLYATRELQIEPLVLGMIFSAFGFGFLLGALSVKKLTAAFGSGKVMVFAALSNAVASLLIPLAETAGGAATVFILFAAHLLLAFGIQIHGINLMSLRQSVTPDNLQGRMNGSFRFVNVFMMMVGGLAAGLLGELVGLRAAIAIGAVGMLLPFVRLFFSPVRTFNQQPEG